MSFQPVIPLSGNSGWKFLQSTYDRQLSTHANSPQIKADRAYLTEKLSEPMSAESFLNDKRLLRVALTAFDLGGEEWKRGFIDKVLKEAATPGSTFLARLNNPKYTAFAQAFKPVNGTITVAPEAIDKIAAEFDTASFESAVGQVDDSMRIALNFKSEIAGLVGNGSSDSAILYRMLGNVPVRTLLETAANLPTEIRKLDIEKQAALLKDSLQQRFGISDLRDLKEPEVIDKIISRYHTMESIKSGAANYSPAANALTLLNGGMGLGGQGGINLLFSGL
ncbi:DUF1217 domain-containing protein [Hyphomonas sp.]|jgi:hypothetical protein|uniref:DUF1217 domain-containing protein n=1 Tax=Hyphomonas sp. TaxID=87 RepID=UPI0025BDBE87|nr:DUF1217 domain-containing protein [Hyphomonas sp.]